MPELTKRCPRCGIANLPQRTLCWRCNADITVVVPTLVLPRLSLPKTRWNARGSRLPQAWADAMTVEPPLRPSAAPLLVLAALGAAFAGCFALTMGTGGTNSTGSVGRSLANAPETTDPFGILPGMKPRYRVVESAPIDLGEETRTRARIVVPPGLSRLGLEANLLHAAKTLYEKRPVDALALLAYTEGTDVHGAYTAGRVLFAPDGDWLRAAHGTPLGKFRARVELADAYFPARTTKPPLNNPTVREAPPGDKREITSSRKGRAPSAPVQPGRSG